MRWTTRLGGLLAFGSMPLAACEPGVAARPETRQPYAGVAAAIVRGATPATTGVVVMRGGAIVYERYFGGAATDTLHDARSTSKSLTALALGIALDAELLPSVEVPALDFFQDLEPIQHDGPDKRAITVEDLLTMSSAFDCDDDDPNSPGNEERMYPKQRWLRWVVDLPTRSGYARDASGRGPWHYCTAGTFLLGQILERATHVPADEFMATRLFAPLGITRWQFAHSSSGEVQTGGQLRLTARDFAALGWLVRSKGQWQGRQVVSKAWIARALTPRRHAFPGQDYGYQFWVQTYRHRCGSTRAWYMSGNGGNTVAIFDELDAVVVITRTHYNQRGMHVQTKALIENEILPELACAPALGSGATGGAGSDRG